MSNLPEMKRFYTALAQLYEGVSRQLPPSDGNPCGSCRSCCHASNMKSHSVSALEFDTLSFHLGESRVGPFRSYIAREIGADGRLLHEACPFLVEEGCSIHELRPLSCRLYGHYRTEETELMSHCAFRGQETVVPQARQKTMMPGCSELSLLGLEYASYRPPQDVTVVTQVRAPENDFDRVIEFMAQQEFGRALQLLDDEGDFEGISPGLLAQLTAECHQALENLPQAVFWYSLALRQAPDNPQILYSLGAVHFLQGELPLAEQSLRQSLALNPDGGAALNLLGVVLLMNQRHGEAELTLARSVQIDSSPSLSHFYLGQAQWALEKVEQAIENFRIATDYEPIREQAATALQALLVPPPEKGGPTRPRAA